MRARARVVELKQLPGESEGMPPTYSVYLVFKGDVVGSATANVSPDLYHRLRVQVDRGEHPEVEVDVQLGV